jgi:hypothetical protein
MAHFVRDTVREALDLSPILRCYEEERGDVPNSVENAEAGVAV